MDSLCSEYPSARSLLEVNLKHLKHNYDLLKKFCTPQSFFCPMVKDQAYGHGMLPIVKTLLEQNTKYLGVLTVSEALQIKNTFKTEINVLIFGPVLNQEEISMAVSNQVTLVINNWVDLRQLRHCQKAKIHLKFDTGFSRLGFVVSEATQIKNFLNQNPHIQLEALCTQLLYGEELWDLSHFSHTQIRKIQALKSVFPNCFIHLFNTSALCVTALSGLSEKFSDIGVRPGIGLYGIKPEIHFKDLSLKQKWENFSLKPIACLKTYVVNVHHLNCGDRVSYGGHWIAQRDSLVITVSLGYGDGFFRSLFSKREVLFRGQRAPIVGTVCMDFFMVDVTDCISQDEQPIILGEEVVIFGEQRDAVLSLVDQSQKIGTIPYEFLVRLGSRVKRTYID